MKPDYKNWIPKGLLFSLITGTALSLALLLVFGVFGIGVSGGLRVALGVLFAIAFAVCAKYTEWCVYAYRSFSYDGKPPTVNSCQKKKPRTSCCEARHCLLAGNEVK